MKHTHYLRFGLSLLAITAFFYLSSCNGNSRQYGCPNKLQVTVPMNPAGF